MDTSVIVAAVHANHPVHAVAAHWLDRAFAAHEVVVAHHSIIESFAVLTRLPAEYRLSPTEAETVLSETLQEKVSIAPFSSQSSWAALHSLADAPSAGGASYDAFIIHLLLQAAVDVIVTYNAADFARLTRAVRVAEPTEV
ncbi:MAG: PIN domain-containing protein [Spirochaetes bacterium]|nr:PIN domain-containing protein [Spirochaetota bacterium]